MLPLLPTELLHTLFRQHISPGDLVIDATAGNGYDTLFLAEAVGRSGKVIAIDIQEQAISATRKRLEDAGMSERITLHLGTHADLRDLVASGSTSAIIFNLGYLPGGDRSVITRAEETLPALDCAVEALRLGGVLAVICYPGHPGGDTEAIAVENFISSHPGLRTARYGLIANGKPAPFLLISCKES